MSILPIAKTPPKPSLAGLTVLGYGPTKIGRPPPAPAPTEPCSLATEPGLNAQDVFQVPILSWDDSFRTMIIDTIDNAYEFCNDYALKNHNSEHESDMGYGKGYGLINNEFQCLLNKLAFCPTACS